MGVAGSQAQNPGGGCFVVVAALDATGAGAGSAVDPAAESGGWLSFVIVSALDASGAGAGAAVDAAAESGGWFSFVGSTDTSHKKSSTDLNITYK